MNLPGVIVAVVVAVVLMAVIRFGMGQQNGTRWTLAALIPGFLLGAALEAGLQQPTLWTALAAWLVGVGLTAGPANALARFGSVIAMGFASVVLITGLPGTSGGWQYALGFQLPAFLTWLLVSFRTQGWAEGPDPRIALVVLTIAGLGVTWIAHLFEATLALELGLIFTLIMAVGWAVRWMITDLSVVPHIWLGGTVALLALAVELANEQSAAIVPLLILVLVFFAPGPENLIARYRETALFRFVRPMVLAGFCLLPVFVSALIAFLVSRGAVN